MITQHDDGDRRRVLASIDPQASVQLFQERGARPIHTALRHELPNLAAHEIERLEELMTEAADLLGQHQDSNDRR